jgi:hypothetical protein
MTLKTLFVIPIVVILVVTLSLAGMLAGQGWSGQARGKAAVEAVEHMRLLLQLQTQLRLERIFSNFALGTTSPTPISVTRRLTDTRRETDRKIAAIEDRLRRNDLAGDTLDRAGGATDPYLATLLIRLASVRGQIDGLLAVDRDARNYMALNAMQPRMVAVALALETPLEKASLAVTAADSTLAGLLIEDRLAASLRDQVGLIAALMLPRFNAGQPPTEADLEQLPLLAVRSAFLTHLIGDTLSVAGSTERVRMAFAALDALNVAGLPARLRELARLEPPDRLDDSGELPPQRILVPWGERISDLRAALVDAAMEQVTVRRDEREFRFDIVLTAFGAVLFAVLESVVLLSQRVVVPLAQLGLSITRIANGDRDVPLNMQSGTREISEMVTAVETLRGAALVADAAASRHRMAVRHRTEMLREALVIARTVQEPAHALERGVASLSEGIDATIALIAGASVEPPLTLGAAADAVRSGLVAMRGSAADLDASFAAARLAQAEERPDAEYLAHIRMVQMQVERREMAVRAFVLPSLVALRDATATACGPERGAASSALRGLVSDQFERIEEAVATMASMRDAVSRAAAIVRKLPDDTPMAA